MAPKHFPILHRLFHDIKAIRLDLSTEKNAQGSLEKNLLSLGYDFQREYRLSESDIPDFMIGSICIELKIKGSAKEIYRQLERYAMHDQVEIIILMTNRSMGLPKTINGKYTHLINIGSAWL